MVHAVATLLLLWLNWISVRRRRQPGACMLQYTAGNQFCSKRRLYMLLVAAYSMLCGRACWACSLRRLSSELLGWPGESVTASLASNRLLVGHGRLIDVGPTLIDDSPDLQRLKHATPLTQTDR